jgi:hypothetical protein
VHPAPERLDAVYQADKSGPFAGVGTADSVVSNRKTQVLGVGVNAVIRIITGLAPPKGTPATSLPGSRGPGLTSATGALGAAGDDDLTPPPLLAKPHVDGRVGVCGECPHRRGTVGAQ